MPVERFLMRREVEERRVLMYRRDGLLRDGDRRDCSRRVVVIYRAD